VDKTRSICAAIAAALTLGFGAAPALAADIGIAASNPGSLYHSTGSAIAKLANDVAKLNATVHPFASATVYLPAVNAGEYSFGVSDVEELRVAVIGAEQFKGREYADLRATTILYPLRVAFFVRNDSPIKTMADLKGKRVVDGFTIQKTIPPLLDAELATAGMTRADIQSVMVPNLARVKKQFPPAYLRPEQPGPRNVGVVNPIHSITYDGVLVASTKMPEGVVYAVVKAMHGNKKVTES